MATTRSNVNAVDEMDEFRPIPPSKYEFVFNDEGIPKKRLIIFEDIIGVNVRQYDDLGTANNLWGCVKCNKKCKFNGTMLMAPITHSCNPITYQEAINQQEKIKSKKGLSSSADAGSVGEKRRSARFVDNQEAIDNGFQDAPAAEEEKVDVKQNVENLNNLPKLEIPPTKYEFGVNIKNVENARIFVFEGNNRRLVYQFSKDHDNKYYCSGCNNVNRRKLYGYLRTNGIFCAPPIHVCQPKSYKEVMEEQQKIKEKFEAAPEHQPSSSSSTMPPSRQIFSSMPPIASLNVQLKPISDEKFKELKEPKQSYHQQFSPVYAAEFDPNLPAHLRQVDVCDYEYGFSERGEKKQRIIIREVDRSFVREYCRTDTDVWTCLNCNIGTATKFEDIFTLTLKHNCEPIPLQISKERQKTYYELYKALSIMNTPNSSMNDSFLRRQQQQMSFGSNRVGGSGTWSHKRMGMPGSPGTPIKIARNSFGQPFDSYGNEDWNFNNSRASTSALSEMGNNYGNGIQRYQPSNTTTTIKLYKPSSFTLEKLCQKVAIDYCDDAYLFWHNIKITQVSPNSIPDQVYPVTTAANPGFSSIALYLTGSESSALKIKEELNRYFIVNHKILSESLGQDLARLDHPLVCQTLYQESATELHFQTAVHLFKCRIGIFSDNKWLRYGNWNELNADIPIFLMEKKNDSYFPILSLKP